MRKTTTKRHTPPLFLWMQKGAWVRWRSRKETKKTNRELGGGISISDTVAGDSRFLLPFVCTFYMSKALLGQRGPISCVWKCVYNN